VTVDVEADLALLQSSSHLVTAPVAQVGRPVAHVDTPEDAGPPDDVDPSAIERNPLHEPEAVHEAVIGFRLEELTARELMALPDPLADAMLVGPLVARGGRTIIVGDTGHGKTALALQLAASVLTGAEALGYQGARTGPVLIVDLEQGLRSIKRALRDAGLDDRDDVIYVRAPDGLALDSDSEHFAELERLCREHHPKVFLLDPYYKAHRGDSNEERGVVDLMRYLDALRSRHGFALILPAHPRKDPASGATRKLTLHDVAGSGAIVRGAEVVIAIERLSHGYARLRILKDRDGDLPVGEPWPLIFTRGEGFKLDPKEEKTAEQLEQRILGDEGAWCTVKEWAADLGIRERRAKEVLEQLVESGQVQTMIGPPGRSPRAHCYSTAPTPWAKSGAVAQSVPDVGTAPTAPTSIGDVGNGRSNGTAPDPGAVDADDDFARGTA
jgi:hypothetical protein